MTTLPIRLLIVGLIAIPHTFAQSQATHLVKGNDFSFKLPNNWIEITRAEYEYQAALTKKNMGIDPPKMELGFHVIGRKPFSPPNIFFTPPSPAAFSFSEMKAGFEQSDFRDGMAHSLPPKLASLFGPLKVSKPRFLDEQKILLLNLVFEGDAEPGPTIAYCVGKSQWLSITFLSPAESPSKYESVLEMVVTSFKWNTP